MHVMDCSCAPILRCSLRRQMAPQQTAKFRTAFFGHFLPVWWRIASPIMDRFWRTMGTGCSLQHSKRFVLPLVGGATRFANVRRKFSRTKKIGRRLVPSTSYDYYWGRYQLDQRNGHSCDNIRPVCIVQHGTMLLFLVCFSNDISNVCSSR